MTKDFQSLGNKKNLILLTVSIQFFLRQQLLTKQETIFLHMGAHLNVRNSQESLKEVLRN